MEHWLRGRICIALPDEEYDRIKKHSEIKWGAICRKAVIQFLNEYEKMKENSTNPLIKDTKI